MNNRKNTVNYADSRMPPYPYGRRTGPAGMFQEQRIPLYLPEPEYSPSLEALKEHDPDAYRMIIYSWA